MKSSKVLAFFINVFVGHSIAAVSGLIFSFSKALLISHILFFLIYASIFFIIYNKSKKNENNFKI